jgi:hypothetical protein
MPRFFSLGVRIDLGGAHDDPCGSAHGKGIDVVTRHIHRSPACDVEPIGVTAGPSCYRAHHLNKVRPFLVAVRLWKANQAGKGEEVTFETDAGRVSCPEEAHQADGLVGTAATGCVINPDRGSLS